MSSLGLPKRRVRTREFLAGRQEICSECVVLCDSLLQEGLGRGLPFSGLLERGRPIIGRAAERFAERALGLRQLPLKGESRLSGFSELRFTLRESLCRRF